MPELPEVESVRTSLSPLVGRRITKARLFRPDTCTTTTGRPARARDLLVDGTIHELLRRGKQLAIATDDNRVLVVHLGMTGQLRLLPRGARPPAPDHIHASWVIDDGSRLIFRDPRRFGGLWALPSREALDDKWFTLGPDALAIHSHELEALARPSRRAIKAVLLDQSVLAGVGNIYADEALFAAAIRPSRPARRLSRDEYRRLATSVRTTLISAIQAGGSTLRDYVTADGRTGSAQLRHAVYGRAGETCIRCGTKLKTIPLAQRTTVYCPNCQT